MTYTLVIESLKIISPDYWTCKYYYIFFCKLFWQVVLQLILDIIGYMLGIKLSLYKFYTQTKWWVTFSPLFPGEIHSPWFSAYAYWNGKKNRFFFFASSKFHRVRNIFYAHMVIHQRLLQLRENAGYYSKTRHARQLICEDIIQGIVININCSHVTTLCNLLQLSFLFLLLCRSRYKCILTLPYNELFSRFFRKYLTFVDKLWNPN